MISVVKARPGPGIEVADTRPPRLESGEALVRVSAAGICGSDLSIEAWKAAYAWMSLPQVLGHEVAGVVEVVADPDREGLLGSRVVVDPYVPCGRCDLCRRGLDQLCDWGDPGGDGAPKALQIGFRRQGGMAQWLAVPYGSLHVVPADMDLDTAGSLEPFVVALHAVRRLPAGDSERVLVLGPGPIGLGILLALKAVGVPEVWVGGTEADETRLARARRLGADRTFTVRGGLEDEVRAVTGGSGVDVAFDATGDPQAVLLAAALTRKGGEVVVVGINHASTSFPFSQVVRREIGIRGAYGAPRAAWREALGLWRRGLVRSGELVTHRYPLARAAAAFGVARQPDSVKVLLVSGDTAKDGWPSGPDPREGGRMGG